MTHLKTVLLACAVTSTCAAPAALAEEAASPHTTTGNITVATDYRFRGVSQTFAEGFDLGPAIQGGIDYSHTSGFYLGNWNSNVSGNSYPNGSSIEVDFYGGFKWSLGDVGFDLGTIYYYYPGAELLSSGGSFEEVENWEAYFGASWKWLSAKYYYAFTDYFSLTEDVLQNAVGCSPNEAGCSPLPLDGGTDGTQYVTATASFELMPQVMLAASLGYTDVPNYDDLSYTDYKVGVTYDLNGWLLGAAVVGSDADEKYWYACEVQSCTAGDTKEIGEPTIVLSANKSF